MVTDELLKSFKDRMKLSHSAEDNYLKEVLATSYEDIVGKCGNFDLELSLRGRELVIERSRYVYNDAIELFDDRFLSMINSFALDNLPDIKEENDARK